MATQYAGNLHLNCTLATCSADLSKTLNRAAAPPPGFCKVRTDGSFGAGGGASRPCPAADEGLAGAPSHYSCLITKTLTLRPLLPARRAGAAPTCGPAPRGSP